MLEDVAKRYYLDGDFNCAESVLLAANEVYALGLDPHGCHRMVSAFGGGMGCGAVCGALAGSMAALGCAAVDGRAHATQDFRELCAGYVERFRAALGSSECCQIKPEHFAQDKRCVSAVCMACRVLEAQMEELRSKNA